MKGPLSLRMDELAKGYRWKAENNIRFYDGLGMSTEEKVEFLSREFAGIQMYFEANGVFPLYAPTQPHSTQDGGPE